MFGLNNTEQDHYCYCFYYQAEGLKLEEMVMLKTNYFWRLTKGAGSLPIITALKQRQEGKMGYILLWLLGVPIPILLVIFLLRGCD